MRASKLAMIMIVVVMFIAGNVAGSARSQESNPTAQAIQTQIADLEATLTAIVPPPSGTAVPVEFEVSGDFGGNAKFRVEVSSIGETSEPIPEVNTNNLLRPRGKFVGMRVRVTNIGTDPATVWDRYKLFIRDDKGRAFSYDSEATSSFTFQLDLYVSSFQPGLTYDAVVVWDVAVDAENFTLEVEDTATKIVLADFGIDMMNYL